MTQFSVNIDSFVDKAIGRMDLVQQKCTLQLFIGVVMRTPVDEGFARNGWQITAGRASNEVPTRAASQEDVISRGAVEATGLSALESSFITNNVPYISVLDRGRHVAEDGIERGSIQAPLGIVDQEIQHWNRHVEDATSDTKQERP